jgi:hypothetical protein
LRGLAQELSEQDLQTRMAILEFCQWLQTTGVSTSIRESTLTFPILEGSHLLGLGVSAGTIAISDLRMMGLIMKKEKATDVMGGLLPFTIAGFVFMMITGALLFWSEPIKCYDSIWFRLKVVFLILAGVNAAVFHLTIWRTMDKWADQLPPPTGARWAGFLSLVLWGLVIAAGRTTAYNI